MQLRARSSFCTSRLEAWGCGQFCLPAEGRRARSVARACSLNTVASFPEPLRLRLPDQQACTTSELEPELDSGRRAAALPRHGAELEVHHGSVQSSTALCRPWPVLASAANCLCKRQSATYLQYAQTTIKRIPCFFWRTRHRRAITRSEITGHPCISPFLVRATSLGLLGSSELRTVPLRSCSEKR